MKRLAHFHEHVVGDVHDVVDRTEANAFQARLQPIRTWPDLHAFDQARAVKRAGIAGFDLDVRSHQLRCRRGMVALAFQRQAGQGGEFTRQAEMAEQVRAVRRDLQVEHHVRLEQLIERRAHGRGGIEDEQAARVLANAEFLATAHHAAADDATELAFLDLEVPWQDCTRQSQRHLVIHLEVLCPAHDLA